MCGRSCVLLLDFHATVVTSTFLFLLFNDTAATEIISVLTHSFPTRRSSDLLRARRVLWRLYDELDRGPVDRRLQMPRPARRRLRPARDGVRDRGALVRRMGSWRPVVGTHLPRKMEPREPCRQVEEHEAGHHRHKGFPDPLHTGPRPLHPAT